MANFSGRRVADRPAVESTGSPLPAQGYRLVIGPDEITLDSRDDEGLRYGRATLAQLRHRSNSGEDGTVVECEINDWPDHAVRGVMLDISRDKVPTMETLTALAGRLAGWKINHLELYMEHTFAYVGHEEVWRGADPFTAAELDHLDRFCSSLGIELVPNQNTLGHFDRWLRNERYRQLAITPDGFDWIFGIRRSPTTLDPAKPGSFELVADVHEQLTSALDKPQVHIGLDEPWELTSDRSGEWVEWLSRLGNLDALRDRELLVWGDMPASHAELMPGLTDLAGEINLTICEWGYEGNHPFGERLSKLKEAGLDCWVCPGTSSWMSVTGRAIDMLENVRGAAVAGVEHGCVGFLVTDWGDFGHHQYLPISDPGFAAAAAFSWCASSHEDLELPDLAALLSAHCFDDDSGRLGSALIALGSVHHLIGPQPPNMSPLAGNILLPQLRVGKGMTQGITPEEISSVEEALESARVELSGARPARADGELVIRELVASSRWLDLACTDAKARLAGNGSIASIPESERAQLAQRVDEIAAEHGELWLERNRPGGLDDSTAWLGHLKDCYLAGSADRGWLGPGG